MTELRDIRRDDRALILGWRNKPDVARYMYTDHLISEAEHDRWFEGIFGDSGRRYWIIRCDERDVGLVNLYDIDLVNRKCSWAFYLGEEGLRGRGVGAFVEYSVLSWVFDRLNFRKLWCEVLAFNEPVVKMHRRFGFIEEGRFRGHILKASQPTDIVRLGILKEEWERERAELESELRKKGILQ